MESMPLLKKVVSQSDKFNMVLKVCAGLGLQVEAWTHYLCSHCWQSENTPQERTRIGKEGMENSFIIAGLLRPLEYHIS